MTEKKRLTLRFDNDYLKELKKLAVDKELTVSELVKEGIDYIMEKYKNEKK